MSPAAGPAPVLHTPRLLLRGWRASDLDAFAAVNVDPEVTRFLSGPLTPEESAAMIGRIETEFSERGFGLWAVEVADGAPFIGFVGLAVPKFSAPFTPCVEVGWRLAHDAWGHGYATEAATAALAYGFGPGGLDEIVSFTTVANARSRAVMERLGMTRDPADDFDHPSLPEGHPLRPHVLYRLPRSAWEPGSAP